MKLFKFKFIFILLFILLQLTFGSKLNKISNHLTSEKTEKDSKNDLKSTSNGHPETKNLKNSTFPSIGDILTKKSNHELSKTEITKPSSHQHTTLIKDATLNISQKDHNINNRKDFFQKTSKKNQNVAWLALLGFLGGFLLFIGSIHLVCWNERKAVSAAKVIDYFRNDESCKVIKQGIQFDEVPSPNKVYLINGII